MDFESFLLNISKETSMFSDQKFYTKSYQILPEFGEGFFEYHRFDGLHIFIFDFLLKKGVKNCSFQVQDTLELSLVSQGEQIFKIDGIQEDIIVETQESYFAYLKNVSGAISIRRNQPVKELKIRMENTFITKHNMQDLLGIAQRRPLENLNTNYTNPFSTKVNDIMLEVLSNHRQGILKRLFLKSKVLEILLLQLDALQENTTLKVPHHPLVKKLYKVHTVVSTHLNKKHTIKALATEVGVNEFVLKREFKRVFGITIQELSQQEKIKKAKTLLAHDTKPIYVIAEVVGYKNATHFTAAFKKRVGLTPKNFRKQHNMPNATQSTKDLEGNHSF